jgi:hypothetical protein
MSLKHYASLLLLILSMVFLATEARANHLAGGYIEYDCISEGTYQVTLNIFQDCADMLVPEIQSVRVVPSCDFNFFSSSLSLSSNEVITELCAADVGNALCTGGVLTSYRLLKYTGTVTVNTTCESFRFFYKFNYRTESSNIVSDLWTFYVHTVVYPQAGVCNSSPRYANPDIILSCVGNGDQVYMSPTDPEGDSLHFSLVSCLQSPGGNSFSTLPYQSGYSPEQPMPGSYLNPLTGLFQYGDAGAGRYSVAMQMDQYDANAVLMSEVHIDFLIVKENCITAGLILGEDALFNLTTGVNQTGPKELSICQSQYFCAEYVYALDDPSLMVNSVDNLNSLLSNVSVTWTQETDSFRLRFCGTSPSSAANLILQFNVYDNHCPYQNFLLTEVFLNVTDASSPLVDIEQFGSELYMTTPTPGESYQWYENGSAITGASASSLLLNNAQGLNYYLIVISSSGCVGTSNTISIPLALSELNKTIISIHPNPAYDQLIIRWTSVLTGVKSIEIYDLQGRILSSLTTSEYEPVLDLSSLNQGMYQLRVLDEEGTQILASFIKE